MAITRTKFFTNIVIDGSLNSIMGDW